MGQRLTRPIRNFNVENRAAKALERQQKAPKAAPKHASSVDAMSHMQQDKGQILDDVENKNERLHERLKQIYVDSKDAPIQIKSARTAVPLTRQTFGEPDLGVMDVTADTEVPRGKSSLKVLMSFISRHQEDPNSHPATVIAKDHSLDPTVVQNVLTHFKVMHLHLPKDMYKETKDMGKIVAEQLEASSSVATSFKLQEGKEGREAQKSISGQPNTGESKT
ncbi:NADH dehydrogenase [ubiquinone] 1 alpha subcomplex assembly factor 4 [Elysia marginata]|uniref:NADH dehydrogenase [ubiquinone] 1 alpha subcomplex assembly factor 4 n=1 Tax=Elysia marginata TaxID=1093978 RepID=A0AAV4H921_9GAST|nr:NADH dehydrogenase [ubiquinone] 1 alpha subcomplex assembly factor 4 [Elysia marginata]